MDITKADERVADKDEAVETLLGFSPIELQDADSGSSSEAASCGTAACS